jgi:AraC-like DNA-binding protein
LPVSAIAAQLGFADPSNFSAFFTHEARDTPTAFRHRQRAM